MIEVRRYQRPDGKVPLTDWLAGLADARIRAKGRQTRPECRHQEGQGVLVGLEAQKQMRNLKRRASVAHIEATIAELRADRAFAVEYLKSALEELDDPEHRAVGLLALRDVAEAYGGLATVAQEAGITREALYRALSPRGNPTLKTLLAVLHAVGMRLSVIPADPVARA